MKNYFFRNFISRHVILVSNDLKLLKKIFQLIESIKKTPFEGLGKQGALKYEYKGYWSRKINEEHRLINEITNIAIIIHSDRYHYK